MSDRILGNLVGEVLSLEDLALISGGLQHDGCDPDHPCCNGCKLSTSTDTHGPGCKCD